MPKSKFQDIYKDIKYCIESGEYQNQQLLPSENTLVELFCCSRNTIRRAIALLADEGYVQALHGKGVRVIYQPVSAASFSIGGIETFKESAERNKRKTTTKVLTFDEITCDERLSRKTGFEIGEELFFVRRVRNFEGKNLILDTNFFSKKLVPGLTVAIAEDSIYEYIENQLGMLIMTSRRTMTVERATPADEVNLDLGDYNCLAVVTGQTYNNDGLLFEYTQSRHRPDYFSFQTVATRKTII